MDTPSTTVRNALACVLLGFTLILVIAFAMARNDDNSPPPPPAHYPVWQNPVGEDKPHPKPVLFTARPVLRRLHLVRPDLINYPLPYEVYA